MSIRDVFVDRKRIQFGCKITEGEKVKCEWFSSQMYVCFSLFILGVFGVMYDGYLTNAEDDVEGAVPVIIKTVKGMRILWQSIYKY